MKILIAHGDGLVLSGVRHALAADAGFDVVGEVQTGAAVPAAVEALQPEIVLLEARIPGVGGIDILTALRTVHPEVKVVMCDLSADPLLIEAALARGACGYIVERITAADLPAAIRQAADATAMVPRPTAPAIPVVVGEPLTAREADVLHAVARGLSNKAIARELDVTVQTVKYHLTRVYRKLRVTNRTEAARWALYERSAE